MPTQTEYAAAHREARRLSQVNSQAFIVDPETLEVLWIEEDMYEGPLAEIYYCGRKYDLAE